jgi:hypothetical protein
VTNTPTTGVSLVGGELHTTLGLPSHGATLDAHPGYAAGPGLINIGLLTNGNAYCRAPSSIAVSPSSTPVASLNGVSFQRFNLTLDNAGAKAGGIEVTLPAGQLSTLDDGIPDYVKLGLGFDPAVLPDRTGQTNSNQTLNYLQILLDGAGVPLRNTSGTALELHLRPWSHDGLAAANIPARVAGALLPDGRPNPGVRLTVHDVSGEPLDTGLANHWGYFGAGQTAAWLRDVGRGGRASVTVASTTPGFALDFTPPYNAATFFQGRELAGLVVLPAATPNTFTHPYGGGSDAAEAAAWRAAAIAYYLTNLPPTLGVTIDPLETALTFVFEQWVTKRFIERGLLPASYPPTPGSVNTNRLTLTAWRASEPAKPIPATGPVSGLVLPTPEQLASLEAYRSAADLGHKLSDVVKTLRETLRDSADPKMAALQAVTLDVYRLSARWGGIFPGAFPSPLDALREFLATGVMPVAYRNDWTNGLPPEIGPTLTPLGPADYATALDGLSVLLALPAPRPVVVRDLVVRPDSVGLNCTLLNRAVLGTPVALVTAEGRPFRFPSAFALVPGVAVRVTAYADLPASACAAKRFIASEATAIFAPPCSENRPGRCWTPRRGLEIVGLHESLFHLPHRFFPAFGMAMVRRRRRFAPGGVADPGCFLFSDAARWFRGGRAGRAPAEHHLFPR